MAVGKSFPGGHFDRDPLMEKQQKKDLAIVDGPSSMVGFMTLPFPGVTLLFRKYDREIGSPPDVSDAGKPYIGESRK
jgi:hypothetical protein